MDVEASCGLTGGEIYKFHKIHAFMPLYVSQHFHQNDIIYDNLYSINTNYWWSLVDVFVIV